MGKTSSQPVDLLRFSIFKKSFFYSSILLGIFSLMPLMAQTIVVKPYLQNAGPNEMTIMWEVDGTGDGFVEWGLTPFDLFNTLTSTVLNSDENNFIHTAKITDLQSQTKYYYRVKSDAQILSNLEIKF